MIPIGRGARHFLLSLDALFQHSCVRLPPLSGRTASVTLAATDDTRLGRSVAPLTREHRGASGIVTLGNGHDAFATRVLLADAAERTLDAQYYVWHDDMTGMLLFDALRRAADRGVRVRLLLDDNNTRGMDRILAALDAHPNIEVRLFNPLVHRGWGRFYDFLVDFRRLNRRMHNKSFTVDDQVTIVGGRNIGNEYFGAGDAPLFVDLDVLAIGPIVHEVSEDFDRYWASASAYPAGLLIDAASDRKVRDFAARLERLAHDSTSLEYTRSVAESPIMRDLTTRSLSFEWAATTMLSDDPAKVRGRVPDSTLMWTRLRQSLGRPRTELELISPYFVPGSAGTEYFVQLVCSGVKVDVLTNSLEATDVAVVHAGYAKRRPRLLEGGVSLFEMKRMATTRPAAGVARSGASSLHAKTISVDRTRVFVGSFNFDPRSARLNTELGFVIESRALAERIADAFTSSIRANAFSVQLNETGTLRWVERREQKDIVYDKEPGTSAWRRFLVRIMSKLPIEWLL